MEYLRTQGYKAYTPANPFGKGNIQTRLKNVDNGMIGNESIDHYSTTIRVSRLLIQRNVPILSTNHNDDVDIVTKIGEKTLAIEYEVSGSHNFEELVVNVRWQKRNMEKWSSSARRQISMMLLKPLDRKISFKEGLNSKKIS